MRLLLDEQLPRVLAVEFPWHEVRTVRSQGWTGIRNGTLLRLAAEAGFEVFLTSDRGIEFEQNLAHTGVAVVMFVARSNRLEHLLPLVKEVEVLLPSVAPGRLVKVGG
ncbi:MAG: hypothetical protein DWQ36_04165 [Acidobacteria bacterium]|nr:MAG: hypothetical protein DWQ30_17445 [Acidobacteriota bacterium]REK10496.1 MAG: hypothetical protein DWQ36_04165 [Acidobacteriota bacterium]